VVREQAAADTEPTQADRADTGWFRVAVEIEAPGKRLPARAGAASLRDTHARKAIALGKAGEGRA